LSCNSGDVEPKNKRAVGGIALSISTVVT
jgi:hypothetical protein